MIILVIQQSGLTAPCVEQHFTNNRMRAVPKPINKRIGRGHDFIRVAHKRF